MYRKGCNHSRTPFIRRNDEQADHDVIFLLNIIEGIRHRFAFLPLEAFRCQDVEIYIRFRCVLAPLVATEKSYFEDRKTSPQEEGGLFNRRTIGAFERNVF